MDELISIQVRRRQPASNAERQRKFRERNPDYYRRLQAQRRAGTKAHAAMREAVTRILSIKPQPLMLPAPVVIVEIPGMTTLHKSAIPEPLPISNQR